MPSLTEAHIRHAAYYLHKAQDYAKSWDAENPPDFKGWLEFDKDLTHLRAAWEWVSQESDDLVLTFAYARLSWALMDITRDYLAKALLVIEHVKDSIGNEQALIQAMGKIDEILSNQVKMLATVSAVFVQGKRNVGASTIINSLIITGDNVSIGDGFRETDLTSPISATPIKRSDDAYSIDR